MAQNNNSINKTETNNLRAHTPSPRLKGQNHPEINQQVQIKTKKMVIFLKAFTKKTIQHLEIPKRK